MAESALIALSEKLVDLMKVMADQQASAAAQPSTRTRLPMYDGSSKGLVARQWLLDIGCEIRGS